MNKKTDEDWKSDFQFTIDIFTICEKFENDKKQLKRQLSKLRNPVLFDINLGINLTYKIPNNDNDIKYMYDHVIGLTNIGMYIFNKKLYKKWETIEDYKNCLNSLMVKIKCPNNINNKKLYKKDWIHNLDNIENCINWNQKLKNNGILLLENINNTSKLDVDTVWQNWYDNNKQFLE